MSPKEIANEVSKLGDGRLQIFADKLSQPRAISLVRFLLASIENKSGQSKFVIHLSTERQALVEILSFEEEPSR